MNINHDKNDCKDDNCQICRKHDKKSKKRKLKVVKKSDFSDDDHEKTVVETKDQTKYNTKIPPREDRFSTPPPLVLDEPLEKFEPPEQHEKHKKYKHNKRESRITDDYENEIDNVNTKRRTQTFAIDLSSLFGGASAAFQNEDENNFVHRIKSKNMPEEARNILLSKLPKNRGSVSDKTIQVIETVLKIPYNTYTPTIKINNQTNLKTYFQGLKNNMDRVVYGLDNVKSEIIEHIAQTMTSKHKSSGRVLALKGSHGVAKTKLVRNGISTVLNRPMKHFSLCGVKDASHFYGFDQSYHNAKHGIIVQSLIESKVSDPIFFFDELDKISGTDSGDEIMNLLMQMTDPIQNHDFRDKFLSEFSIDLSRVFFIFAFNDKSKINPILLDRLHIVEVQSPSDKDKIVITEKYLIPELCFSIGIDSTEFEFTEEIIKYIIKKYDKSEGVRTLRRCIESIILKMNYWKLIKEIPQHLKVKKFPIVLTEKIVDFCLINHNSEKSFTAESMYA